MAIAKDPLPPVGTPDDVVHVDFTSHHVTVQCNSARIIAGVRAVFGPMMSNVPRGACAGRLDIVEKSGTFRMSESGSRRSRPIDDPAWAIHELYDTVVKLLMRARQDLIWLHAGVAAIGGCAHVLCGPSGAGKSTIVGGLVDRGWTYLSDEIAAIDATAGVAHPFPLAPHRRTHEGTLLDDPESVRQLPKIAVNLPANGVGQLPLSIAAIYLLHSLPGSSGIHATTCSPAQSVLALLHNSLSISSDREREIGLLAQLVARVPAVKISYGDVAAVADHVHGTAVTLLRE